MRTQIQFSGLHPLDITYPVNLRAFDGLQGTALKLRVGARLLGGNT
jgi:hypothetical protein